MTPAGQLLIGVLIGLLAAFVVIASYYRAQCTKERQANQPIRGQLRELTKQYDEIYRRSGEYFQIIDRVQKERDVWQNLYRETSVAAGNTQSRLLVERARNFQLLLGNKIKPYHDPIIDQLVGAYMEEEGEQVKQPVGGGVVSGG